MGAHPKTFARFAENIRQHPGSADYWLDQWFYAATRASEYDGQLWGFDPDRWCETERAQMARLHGCEPRPRPRWPWARPSHT